MLPSPTSETDPAASVPTLGDRGDAAEAWRPFRTSSNSSAWARSTRSTRAESSAICVPLGTHKRFESGKVQSTIRKKKIKQSPINGSNGQIALLPPLAIQDAHLLGVVFGLDRQARAQPLSPLPLARLLLKLSLPVGNFRIAGLHPNYHKRGKLERCVNHVTCRSDRIKTSGGKITR